MTPQELGSKPAFNHGGMTLREYYAGQALAGLLASYAGREVRPYDGELTKDAVTAADALLEELAGAEAKP